MRRRGVHPDDMYDHDPTLAAFARDLREATATTPAPALGASLAAVLDGRAPTAVYPDVLSPPEAPARRPLRLRWALAASAALGIATSSLGVAGALPGPVQRQVSRMAEVVGVDLPDGRDDRDDGPPPFIPETPTVPPSGVVPPRPSVVPPEDRPVPSTVPDDPSNRGNREGRGHGDDGERSTVRPQSPAGADGVGDDLGDERNGRNDAGDDDRDEDGSGPGDGRDEAVGDSELEKLDGRRNPSTVAGVHAKD